MTTLRVSGPMIFRPAFLCKRYTGASAGPDTHASIENFLFEPGNTYNWDLGVASGQVASTRFQGVKLSWEIFSAWQRQGSCGSTAKLLESSRSELNWRLQQGIVDASKKE